MVALDHGDVELIEPPADLWGRIAAAVAGERSVVAKVAPSRQPAGQAMVVEYWIDADDVVGGVGGDWDGFARDNDAAELVALPGGRTLWSYFDRDEIRELWRLVVDRVRSSGVTVQVPLRCDAPAAKRWFEMSVVPHADGRVRFRSVLLYEEPRPAVTLLDPAIRRDPAAPPVEVCSWCGRASSGGDWLDVEDLVAAEGLLERPAPPGLSYGLCEPCRADMSAELLVSSAARRSASG